MYISGSQHDLHVRMHEFTRNSGDLNSYILEAQSYTLPVHIKEILNREHNKQLYSNHQVVNTGKKF